MGDNMIHEDELVIELSKNKADEYIVKVELENAKKKYINYIENDFNKEFREDNLSEINKPIKYKKPFSLKMKDFFNRLSEILR